MDRHTLGLSGDKDIIALLSAEVLKQPEGGNFKITEVTNCDELIGVQTSGGQVALLRPPVLDSAFIYICCQEAQRVNRMFTPNSQIIIPERIPSAEELKRGLGEVAVKMLEELVGPNGLRPSYFVSP